MYSEYSLGKRLLAFLLSLVLIAGMLPVNHVSAAEGDEENAFAFEDAEPENLQYEENLLFLNPASGGEGSGEIRYALLTLSEEEDDSKDEEPEFVELDSTEVATIDVETGELTILMPGMVTVRATKAADGEIPEQTAQYELEIERGKQKGFAFTVKSATEAYTEDFKYLNVATGGESTGKITYSIADGADITVINEETGELSIAMPGQIKVSATKDGDEKYIEATASYTLVVTKGVQTGFAFAVAEPEPVVYEEGLTFTNVASGGETDGAVVYEITDGTDVAAINVETGELLLLTYGTVTVTATKAGDDKYNDAVATYTLDVTKLPQTGFAFETAAPEAMVYAEDLTFTNKASGGEGTGEITYAITKGEDVAAIDEDGVLTILKHGEVTVTATKAEDETYAEAKAVYTLVINGWQQEELVFDIAEPDALAYEREGMTYTNAVTGGSGTGALTYSITEGKDIAQIDENGTLTIKGKGVIVVVAEKAADDVYEKATAAYTLVVAEPQDAFRFDDPKPMIVYSEGGTFQQIPVGGSGEGKISYNINPEDWAVAKIDTATGVLTIKKSGTVVVKAVKAADGKYAASKATYTLTIEKADQTGFKFPQETVELVYNSNENKFKLEAAGGEDTNGEITYEIVSGNAVAKLADEGNELHILKGGQVVVRATKKGNDCYNDATAELTLNIDRAEQTISFEKATVHQTYGIRSYKNTVTVSELCSDHAPVFEIAGENTIGAKINSETGELTLNDTNGTAGSITVKVTKDGDDCYYPCEATYVFDLTYEETPEVAYSLVGEQEPGNKWFTSDVKIMAPEGYLISCENQLAGNDWKKSVECYTESKKEQEFIIYLKNEKTGGITDAISVKGLWIDKTAPVELNIEYKTAAWYEILGSWFGFSKDTVKVIFSAKDPVSSVRCYEYSLDGGATFTRLGDGISSVDVPAQCRGLVVMRAMDMAGNAITTLDDGNEKNDDQTLVVDDKPPVISAEFDGAYHYVEEDDTYYTNSSTFGIALTVTDENYDLRGADPEVKVDGIVQDMKEWSSTASEGKAMLRLPKDGTYEVTVAFTDRSGNKAEELHRKICVDTVKPVRTVEFNAYNRAVDIATMTDAQKNELKEGDSVVAYYNDQAVATIQIIEKNFFSTDVTVNVNGKAAEMAEWREIKDNTWQNTVTLNQEGDHVITVNYKDRAQNDMEVYQSQQIIIDKTDPEIEVSYGNQDSQYELKGRKYFDTQQTAKITIKEHNFRADDVRILVKAVDVNGENVLQLNGDGVVKSFADRGTDRAAWTPYVEGTWRNTNDIYTLDLVFADDANYTFDVEYTDLAQRSAVDYTEVLFTVDQTAPENLKIEFSEDLEEPRNQDPNVMYYNDTVVVTITAEDTTSGIRYFDYSYINAYGVSSVNAELLDQQIEAESEGAVGRATFRIPREELEKDNQFNGTVSMTAVNRSGKKTDLEDTRRIVVDNIKPEVNVEYNAYAYSETDVDYGSDEVDIHYYADKIVGTITITEANFVAEDVIATLTRTLGPYTEAEEKTIPLELHWKDKSVDVHVVTFEIEEPGYYKVNLSYTDRSQNVMKDYTTPQYLVIDMDPPTDLGIRYEGEDEEDHKSFSETILDNIRRVFYYDAPVEVTLTATDKLSGVYSITLDVTSSGAKEATSIKLPKDLEIGYDEKTKKVKILSGEAGAVEVIGADYDEGVLNVTCRIPEQFRGALKITARDDAGNHAQPYTDDVVVVVDTIAPGWTVSYEASRVVENAGWTDLEKNTWEENDKDTSEDKKDVVLFFNNEAVANFTIKEANFHPNDDTFEVMVNGERVEITDWTNDPVESDIWRSTLKLGADKVEKGDGDDDYIITAKYTDRSGNVMKTYQSQRIVVDKIAPVITTEYSNTDVKNTIDGRDYLAAQQTAKITIKEHNFRADDVKILVTAKNAAGSDVLEVSGDFVKTFADLGIDRASWTPYAEGTWRNDNDTYVLELPFSADANYTFDVQYADLATNSAGDYEEYAFTVDTAAPTGLSISYSQSVTEILLDAITFGFYNDQATVTISANDETSGIHYFVYSYLNAAGVSGVNAELSNQQVQASGSGGSGSAQFTIPGDALRENNQFNGTVQFSAHDRSENSASMADDRRIVVDNISPTVTVTYEEPVQTIEDVTYYNEDIQCSIEINEANFYAEDVVVTVTKDEVEYDVTVQWTRNSADINTGTFTLTEDGVYTVAIQYTDKSGNEMVDYLSETHILDTTLPEVKISNIKANSANKDEPYGFTIELYDINLDVESMMPVLTAVIRDEKGIYAVEEIDLGEPVETEEDVRYTYTVENLTEDALYALSCTAMDLAENECVEMLLEDGKTYEKVDFSINRNGSTFAYGNAFTEALVNQYYVYSVEEDVVIVEINVDPIEDYCIELNGEELAEGTDFVTTQTSNEGEWSRRVYYIDKGLFAMEGEYKIIISTVDKAKTTAYSDVKNLAVAFVVDQTKPAVTITGLESGGRYQTNEQTVTLIPTDEGGRLNKLYVVVYDSDGKPMKNAQGEDISVRFEMEGDEFLKYLEEHDGKVVFTVPEGLNNRVQIICNDCAVNAENLTNEYNELFNRVTVSQNKLIIFYANTPLFYGSVAGILGLAVALIVILVKRRKKKEDR